MSPWGAGAGILITQGNNNIDIGNLVGVTGDSATIRIDNVQTRTFIAGISGIPVTGTAVVVDGSGQLGVAPSSKRFKEGIRPMDNESETILAQQQKEINALKAELKEQASQIQKVSAQIQLSKPEPQTVLNSH